MVFKKDNIFMRIGLLCIMLTIVSMQMSLGQNSFHRTYPAENEDIYVLDAIQLRGGRYASLSKPGCVFFFI
jgi:hypothetical protein